ncbi:MAG: xanthine dehydrogenase molybdopterin binding subunit [Gammaproteobacteria bacterium]
MTKPSAQSAGYPAAHDSATLHVCGEAQYVDDIPLPENALHAALGLSARAHAGFAADLSPVALADGVVAVVAAGDIPGENDIAPVQFGDPLFAGKVVHYAGQCIFAAAADSEKAARRAVRAAKINYQNKPAILTIEDALKQQSFLQEPKNFFRLQRGDAAKAIKDSPHQLVGEAKSGAQEHFYLEGQAAVAMPLENGDMLVWSSTQNPTEVQHLCAKVLHKRMHNIIVRTRRMGGGFGGKETQAALPACAAALLAGKTGRAVKLRLPRGDDIALTGKRHPFLTKYNVGFDDNGKIRGADMFMAADCGMSADLSNAVIARAVFHGANAYYFPAARIVGAPCRTNKASNTAFRGFGGPQGMFAAERMLTDIADYLGKDPLAVRRINLIRHNQTTIYGQKVHKPAAMMMMDNLAKDANYAAKQKAAARFNRNNKTKKRGVAITPVQFGIAFTTAFLNQAGALVQIYKDGTIIVHHGGTEMGQGLFVKVAQITAAALGVPLSQVRCAATCTSVVPNTSATAASSGSDLNAMAAQKAALILRERMAKVAAEKWQCAAADIVFDNGKITSGRRAMTFAALADMAYHRRVSLSAAGYYRTPKVHFDAKSGSGAPFYYFAEGAALVCCQADLLTGEHRLLSADILHETGASINPAIDKGQIEGGFAQGWGWLSCEEAVWDNNGNLMTTGPATYKIPAAGDMPKHFRARLWQKPNAAKTVMRSKAVGEPPLMLALAGWCALANAIKAAGGDIGKMQIPMTPENTLATLPPMTIPSARKSKTPVAEEGLEPPARGL